MKLKELRFSVLFMTPIYVKAHVKLGVVILNLEFEMPKSSEPSTVHWSMDKRVAHTGTSLSRYRCETCDVLTLCRLSDKGLEIIETVSLRRVRWTGDVRLRSCRRIASTGRVLEQRK